MRRLAIALITYGSSPRRTEYALATVKSVVSNLQLADADIGWYVADDGSPRKHYDAVLELLRHCDQKLIGKHHDRMGPGVSQNIAAANAFGWSDVVLWLEDDWVLETPYDVTKHYDLVCQPPEGHDVRMVRMGYLTVGVAGLVIGHDWVHYLKLSRATQYSFSGHPALRHRTWWDAYGPYCGSDDAGFCEIDMDARWRAQAGPEIVWPLDQSGWGRFQHIGGEKA